MELVGIIRIERTDLPVHSRQRVFYYAEPLSPVPETPKFWSDEESHGAKWATIGEVNQLHEEGKLRGFEPVEYFHYIETGGTIFPLSILTSERSGVPKGEDFNEKLKQINEHVHGH